MSEFSDDIDDTTIPEQYQNECKGCDILGTVNDLGLCRECAGKLERDLIRNRDWAYSVTAYGCPENKLEDLRNKVIKKYGKKLELIAEDKPKKKKKKRKRHRKKQRNG